MSTAPTISSPTGNTSANTGAQSATQGNVGGRSTMRANNQAKSSERKQSPNESGQRAGRPAAPKAWASGTNPITQRNSSSPQSNGVVTPSKSTAPPKMTTQKEASLSDRNAHDRLLYVLGASIGLSVLITSKSGEKFEGILAGSTLLGGSSKLTTKMTKKVQGDSAAANGAVAREAAFIGSSPEFTTTFDVRDLVDVQIPEFSVPEPSKMSNGTHAKFQTDTDISGNRARGERKLERWVPDESDDPSLSLGAGSVGDWDQFAANKQLTGKDSTYEEGIYTTHINRDAADYRDKVAYAEMKKREIEGATSTNVHVREERGHMENDDEDEEAKYSGVRRADGPSPPLAFGGPNKYTPPARRAPTGQPTVPGVPVDTAIVSAQMAAPASVATTGAKAPAPTPAEAPKASEAGDSKVVPEDADSIDAAEATTQKPAQNQTEGVENKVLQVFRQFADSEKQKLLEKKRAQASQDRTIKLNELRRFAENFKLNSEVPTDLVGILAKDPVKQEAIIKKAKQDLEEPGPTRGSATGSENSDKPGRKGDIGHLPGIPERPLLGRGRGGYPQGPARAQQPNIFAGRNATIPARPGVGPQDRKPTQPLPIPAPIPILDGRTPPTGPMADQPGMSSPQRSNLQTPTSATSPSRLNVRASEFRPNAAAPAFNPTTSSNAPSSPSSTQRAASVSRAASPSIFFRSRKPKATTERPSISTSFNTIKKLRTEVTQRLAGEKTAKPDGESGPPKDYAANGGIPNAYQTAPRWTVRMENEEKTYLAPFERPSVPMMQPTPSRSGSSHQIPYAQHMGHMPNGPANVPQISTPQHMHQPGPQQFGHQFDESQRMQMSMATHAYSSPSIPTRQPSAFASPMVNPAQLAYAQQPYFGAGNAQMPMQMRQYPGTPGVMHPQPGQVSAPIMVQQQSSGPYMQMPQQFNQQMPMYSPNPGHAYPQQNGYGSPSRAPMMVAQGSQQGQHGQPMMYTMSSQSQMGFPQQAQMNMMRGNFQGHQYGSSPQQPYPMPRAMSGGYGQIPQKMMPQHMQLNQGPPMNAPQQPAAYAQMAMGQEDGK